MPICLKYTHRPRHRRSGPNSNGFLLLRCKYKYTYKYKYKNTKAKEIMAKFKWFLVVAMQILAKKEQPD